VPIYDPRGGGNVHIDVALTNISLGYVNNGMVGDTLAPAVRVRKQSDLYYVFGREAWFPEDDLRSPGGEAVEIPGLKVSTSPYFCFERALQIAITDEERENADSPLSPDRDGVELVTNKVLLRREKRIQTAVHTAANYHTGHTVTLAGTDQWSDLANSDPIGDLKDGLRKVHSALFMEPNLGVIPYQVMAILEDHPDFIERIKYSQPGIITADIIASVVGLQRIVVPGLGYNSAANPNATATLGYLWGKDVVLAWVPDRAGLKIPAFMYEFVWVFPGGREQVVVRWREDKRESDIVRVKRRYDHKFVAVDGGTGGSIAGYLIKSAVA
jgi:hypothetical protein